jgi:transcriptional regulator with GAF, ATPase, and Fis domain
VLNASVDTSRFSDVGRGRSIRKELAAAGVVDDSGTAVVLIADTVDDETEAVVGERSCGGLARLLAVCTDQSARSAPWGLLHAGASDVVQLGPGWATAVALRLQRWEAVDALVDGPLVRGALVGDSAPWRRALRRTVEAARFTDAPVLITGESGTGKELVARLVHALDTRPDRRDLVLVDCTTVVPSLSGSEFFGHEKGAFTGAIAARDGAFSAAHAGTLFLDEIGELPAGLQAELLRVVQEGSYKRVGGNVWHRTLFRLVCATNRDLKLEQAQGRFRSDLYYRLAGALVHLPPLRHRRGDVLPLFRHFLAELRADATAPELHPAVVELLHGRDYPGNVRDLRQLAARVHARHVGEGPVTPGDVPTEDWPETGGVARDPFVEAVEAALAHGMTYTEIRDAATTAALRLSLDDAGGNAQAAAARLAVTDRTVQKFQAERRLRARPTVSHQRT